MALARDVQIFCRSFVELYDPHVSRWCVLNLTEVGKSKVYGVLNLTTLEKEVHDIFPDRPKSFL